MSEPAASDDLTPAAGTEVSHFMALANGAETAEEPVFRDHVSLASAAPSAPIGPGMWEAILWIAGFFLIEIMGSVAGLFAGIAFRFATGQAINLMGPQIIEEMFPWMIGVSKSIEVIAVLIFMRLRFGPAAFRLTGFRRVPAVHLGVLCFAMVPTAFASGQLYMLFDGYWDRLAEHVELLQELEKLSSVETVQAMAASTPIAVLVLIIAVLPALNEEFLCRAAIGRGLVGHYGVIAGVALTSMLFAAMHLSPVHAAALVPLAVLLHVGYLSSGSIWWPVIVHFLNNAMSVVLMKLASIPPEEGGMADPTESQYSPLLLASSIACVAATVWLLWTMRLRWRTEAGRNWEPNPFGVDPPPRLLEATPYVPTPPTPALLTACLTYLLFPVALVASIWLNRSI